jgi:hypothetical protein
MMEQTKETAGKQDINKTSARVKGEIFYSTGGCPYEYDH